MLSKQKTLSLLSITTVSIVIIYTLTVYLYKLDVISDGDELSKYLIIIIVFLVLSDVYLLLSTIFSIAYWRLYDVNLQYFEKYRYKFLNILLWRRE